MEQTRQEADLIVTHGKIANLRAGRPTASSLAIRDGRIVAVGSEAEVLTHRGGATRVVDVGGRTVIPGLNDSHIHVIHGGLNYNRGSSRCSPSSGAGSSTGRGRSRTSPRRLPRRARAGHRWEPTAGTGTGPRPRTTMPTPALVTQATPDPFPNPSALRTGPPASGARAAIALPSKLRVTRRP